MGSLPESTPLLNVKIIGAGMAGLGMALALRRKGHSVTVIEASPKLRELGAGLSLMPNVTRIIHTWNLQDAFRRVINEPTSMVFRRYADDNVIGEIPFNPVSEIEYGYPQWHIYRPDLQDILYEAAMKEGAEVQLGCRVKSVDAEAGILTLEDGSTEEADLIVAADGIRSRLRSTISPVEAVAFKEYAFRAIIPKAKMDEDPETAELMKGHTTTLYCGPSTAMMSYTVGSGQIYSSVLAVPRPSDAPLAKWNQPGDLSEVAELLTEHSPLVRKIWSKVDDCAKWTIGEVPPLDSYVSPNGKFVLAGDAAHAIVPHIGQGAAMALEDAAALAEFLSHLPSKAQLPHMMAAYSVFRRERVENIRRMALGNQTSFTMDDGPEQEARDQQWASFAAAWKAREAEAGGSEAYKQKMATRPKIKPDPTAMTFNSPGGRAYINSYDIFAAAKEAAAEAAARLN